VGGRKRDCGTENTGVMPRKRPDASAWAVAIILIVVPIFLNIVLPFLLNVAIFGIVIPFGGLLYFLVREKRPVENPAALLSPDHYSSRKVLESRRTSLAKRKARILAKGQRTGLLSRADGTKFDARSPDARSLNRELDEIEDEFEAVKEEIRQLDSEESSCHLDWENDWARWRFYHSGRITFTCAVAVYVGIVSALYVVSPTRLLSFSHWAARYILLSADTLPVELSGALIVTSCISILAIPAGWGFIYLITPSEPNS
jgi:hypothetical protein